MSRQIPEAIRAVAGLAATMLDEARRLPRTLPGLPVRILGLAMQATMKLQQHYSGLVARGDEVFTGWRGANEPGLATFDEDLPTAPAAGARDSAFDRAPEVSDEELAEEVAGLVDDEVSGLPQEPAPEEVVEALQDITDQVRAAGDVPAPQPGLRTEDDLETALLEADGAPDSALVDGGTADAGLVDTELIAEAPEVDVLTPEGEVATVAATVTDEGIAAPEAPPADRGDGARGQRAAVDEALGSEISEADRRPSAGAGAPAADDHEATGRGDEIVTGAGAHVDEELGSGDGGPAPAAAGEAVATDEGGTPVAAATGVRTDVDETPSPDEGADTAGAEAAGAAPVEGYDGFTIAQLRGHLRGYQAVTVRDLLAYEEATRAREPYLRMLRNRLERLEQQQPEADPRLAPRGI